MIWLAWRQQRFETLLGLGVLAFVAVLLLLTGIRMASAFDSTGVGSCLAVNPRSGCFTVVNAWESSYERLQGLTAWFNFLPLLWGLLLGAPFVAELEGGTYRLAWTQSITRTRWVVIKLGFALALTLLAAGIFTALMTWWRLPFDRLGGNIQPNSAFDFEGTVPFAYAAFAVTLGIAAGTVIRRTIPAFALSIVGFLAVRLSVIQFLRPHYLAPLTTLTSANPASTTTGVGRQDWVLSAGWADRAGHALSDAAVFAQCPPLKFTGKGDALRCFAHHNIFNLTLYQPESRFWTFQAIETALYGGIAAVLCAITVLWIRRRYG